MESAIVYQARDNTFSVTLKKAGVVLTEEEMGAISKFEIKYKGAYFNSVDNSAGFERDNATGTVKIKPYELGLSAGKDNVEFIIYDLEVNTHGLVWSKFDLKVRSDAVPAPAE